MFSRCRNAAITAGAAVLFSALLLSSPARADLIFDLAVGPASAWTGSGSIDFTTGQSEAQRPHLAVNVGMNFRRPPAAADANRLIFLPPLLRQPPPGEL